MTATNLVLKNTYRDSVVLMRISRELELMEGALKATALMGTENNKRLLEEAGLLSTDGQAATPNDLVLALEVSSPCPDQAIREKALSLLETRASGQSGSGYRPRSLEGAVEALPDANLALISIPGEYAAREAQRALDLGLHVLLFSDNVSIDDEAFLKERAATSGLFMLGPDCGTAVINNVPLGFANAVPPGRVGLVAASGTGLQQVTCLLAAAGEGVSQALGVGGRDLDDRVGGAMMLQGLSALEADPHTEAIVLISKPPGPSTEARLLARLEKASKPCVVCFLGADVRETGPGLVSLASNLTDSADLVLDSLGGRPASRDLEPRTRERLRELAGRLGPGGCRSIRGLYSGGTLCYEALFTVRELTAGPVSSNLKLGGVRTVESSRGARGHVLVDLGDDRFTVGRPHPMIDLRQRCDMLKAEAADAEAAILLLDVVLGYGAHPDPASELAPAIQEAVRIAAEGGRTLACVAVLCGTQGDPQGLDRQKAALEAAGAVVVPSNLQAATIAAALSMGSLDPVPETGP
ncbi:MAG: acyl-CoA synthetase FdrA [Dehalococcoidia bacterium]|nr:acyl-CoA synthetase FdrA [Dehalococcoidia bacterium]